MYDSVGNRLTNVLSSKMSNQNTTKFKETKIGIFVCVCLVDVVTMYWWGELECIKLYLNFELSRRTYGYK